MAKKIYPGNWVTTLSSYQGQPVVAVPGRTYYHKIGYALVSSTNTATELDVVIPSPDMRGDDKPRADITGLTIPAGANVYHVGIRVPDMRKDRAIGSATSGLVATNTDLLAVRDAVGSASSTISATVVSTGNLTAASATVAPSSSTTDLATSAALSGNETLQVIVRNAADNAAGTALTSTADGGTPIIVEVCYFTGDVCPDVDSTFVPFVTET